MALGIISIYTTATKYLTTRPTSIKLTFSGDTVVSKTEVYDPDNILISTLTDLTSDVEYSIITGVASSVGVPEYFVPAPIYRLDFTTDLAASPFLKVTNIAFRLNVLNANGELVLMEVTDRRISGNVEDGYADLGTGKIIEGTTTELYSITDIGDLYPAFGIDKSLDKIDYGIVNMPVAKQMRGASI